MAGFKCRDKEYIVVNKLTLLYQVIVSTGQKRKKQNKKIIGKESEL